MPIWSFSYYKISFTKTFDKNWDRNNHHSDHKKTIKEKRTHFIVKKWEESCFSLTSVQHFICFLCVLNTCIKHQITGPGNVANLSWFPVSRNPLAFCVYVSKRFFSVYTTYHVGDSIPVLVVVVVTLSQSTYYCMPHQCYQTLILHNQKIHQNLRALLPMLATEHNKDLTVPDYYHSNYWPVRNDA